MRTFHIVYFESPDSRYSRGMTVEAESMWHAITYFNNLMQDDYANIVACYENGVQSLNQIQ